MDLQIKKVPKAKLIRSMFSAIKRDNLVRFEEIIKEYPELMHFKNNRRENILFYAFENNSRKIIDFVNNCEPGFIKEKNIRNLNILHELILTGKDLDYFFEMIEKWDQSSVQKLFLNNDPQGNNAVLMAAKYGKLENLLKVIKNCQSFNEIQLHSNIYGQTVAHFIASHITEECDEIIKMLSPELIRTLDNINGFSPLMLAAYYQKENNFKAFFDLNPEDQDSFFGNNLIHFAAHNQDKSIVNFLISKGIFKNNKNVAEQSPLLIALIKGHADTAKEIFEQAKNELIYQEDIINAVKIYGKNPDLFSKIINNQKNEELSQENMNLFLDGLFLHGTKAAIIELENHEKYKHCLAKANFNKLFSKTIAGKKDMSAKTNFLLEQRSILTKNETISTIAALETIPANQVKFILSNTDLVSKTLEENKVLFAGLCLSKGINPKIATSVLNVNNEVEIQRAIKRTLRNVKIEETSKHFQNIESWLKIVEDKQVVWKHYGRIIAKAPHPFLFLENNFKFLTRDDKKQLLYYAVTALFKDEKNISEDTFKIIENHKNLLSNVFVGIVKVGKIPTNKKLLEILPKIKYKELNSEDFINVLKKSNKKPKEVVELLKETISMFSLNNVVNMNEFCKSLINNPFHHEMMEEIILSISFEQKDDLMFAYIDNYIQSPSATINMGVLEQLILSYEDSDSAISYAINKALSDEKFENVDFIKKIKYLSNKNLLPHIEYVQDSIKKEDFASCVKLQKVQDKEFEFKKIDFSEIDWNSIDRQVFTMDKSNKFFEFLSMNSTHLTKKQINVLTDSLLKNMKANIIAFETIDRFLNSLGKSINKIDDELLYKLSVDVLDTQCIKNAMTRFVSQNSFDSIFNSISQNKNGKFFEKIKENKNFILIPNETKIVISKEILEESLSNNKIESPRAKKLKI